jgi:hypothetical protein
VDSSRLGERALEIARSGDCISMNEVRDQLERENFASADIDHHLSGQVAEHLTTLIALTG